MLCRRRWPNDAGSDALQHVHSIAWFILDVRGIVLQRRHAFKGLAFRADGRPTVEFQLFSV
jgi:hypothetical protein